MPAEASHGAGRAPLLHSASARDQGAVGLATTGEARLARADFQSAIGTAFVLSLEGGRSIALTLTEVEATPAPPGWERFALLFDGPDPLDLPHDTYMVEHQAMGRFALSVGPVQVLGRNPCYEAVFNRPALQDPPD